MHTVNLHLHKRVLPQAKRRELLSVYNPAYLEWIAFHLLIYIKERPNHLNGLCYYLSDLLLDLVERREPLDFEPMTGGNISRMYDPYSTIGDLLNCAWIDVYYGPTEARLAFAALVRDDILAVLAAEHGLT